MRILRIKSRPDLDHADKLHEGRAISAPDPLQDFDEISLQEFAAMRLSGGRITLDCSTRCNLRCRYCAVPKDKFWDTDWTEVSGMFKLARLCGASTAIITGGEPGLLKNLDTIISDLASWGFKVSLLTNGTWAADARRAEALVRAGLTEVHVSVKEFSSGSFSELTGTDLFEASLSGLNNLLRLRRSGALPQIHANSVLTRHSFPASRILSFFDKLTIFPDFFLFTLVEPISDVNREIVPTFDAFSEGLSALLPYLEQRGIPYRLEGIPLCLLGERRTNSLDPQHSSDSAWRVFVSGKPGSGVVSLHKGWARFLQFKHGEACGTCDTNDSCPGLHKTILEYWRNTQPDLLR